MPKIQLPPSDDLRLKSATTPMYSTGTAPGRSAGKSIDDLFGDPPKELAALVEEPRTHGPIENIEVPRALEIQAPLYQEPERDPLDKTLWIPPVPTFTGLFGPAGCGKTFATRDWASREKGLLLCATTGIAAINLGGTTINSALGYFDTKSLMDSYTSGFLSARLGKLWKAGIRRLVLDEVSMLDGDQLTYLVKGIEEVNGRGYVIADADGADDLSADGTGGLGLTLVGDFAQLPPVKAPFAFESIEWNRFEQPGATITLTEIRRQADPTFIEALRNARRGLGHLAVEVFGPGMQRITDDTFDGPTLLAKNDAVDRYNWIRMNQLQGEAHKEIIFTNERWGKQRSEWGNPNKPPNTWGIPPRVQLKVGCLVMVLANKKVVGLGGIQTFDYVNGDLGIVVDGSPESHTCDIQLHRTGQIVHVEYVRREVLTPMDASRRKELIKDGKAELISDNGRFEIEGWIDYLPLRVAYASTVHKSQGLSLDKVQVNISDAFFKTPGMIYVALSRARTLEGLRLVGTHAAFIERCMTDKRLARWL